MAYLIKSNLANWNLEHKRVLMRADLNVPLSAGTIIDDFRLKQIQPTLDYIISHGGSIVLASHMGRPTQPDPALSTRNLITWFTANNYRVEFAENLEVAHKKISSLPDGTMLLLENMRFFKGETKQDPVFACSLATLADYYVNDAFGTLHRTDSSVTLVARYFSQDHRTIGLLVERELQMLNKLLINPARPFILIVGGAKVREKIPLIDHLLNSIDCLILCPATVFSFMYAQGQKIGRSLVDPSSAPSCKAIMEKALSGDKTIIMPLDYQIAANNLNGPLSLVAADKIPHDAMGISIGPKTEQQFANDLVNAGTIFYNGLMGLEERPETLQGFRAIVQAMIQSKAYTAIGGGDTVAAAVKLGLANQLSFCSTGGGATLTYISGQPLAGIESIIKPGYLKC